MYDDYRHELKEFTDLEDHTSKARKKEAVEDLRKKWEMCSKLMSPTTLTQTHAVVHWANSHNAWVLSGQKAQPSGRKIMLRTIDFDRTPLEVIHPSVLKWWLLARGIDNAEGSADISTLVRQVEMQRRPILSQAVYITTFSSKLKAMEKSTGRIPLIYFDDSSSPEGINPDSVPTDLVNGLKECQFDESDCKSTSEHPIAIRSA